jgi:DNA-binding response OmpR family regulator
MIGSKKVLVVDDLQQLREAIVFELEMADFEVREAENGEQALEVLAEFPCDVLVSDIRMPKCDGAELLRRVRKRHGPNPPVLFVSAFSDLSVEEAFELGVNGFVSKPFEPSEFLWRVKRFCDPIATRLGPCDQAPQSTGKLVAKFESLGYDVGPKAVLVGQGGIFIPQTKIPYKLGQIIELNLSFNSGDLKQLNCFGQVQWMRPEPNGSKIPGLALELFGLQGEEYEAFLKLAEKSGDYLPGGDKLRSESMKKVG